MGMEKWLKNENGRGGWDTGGMWVWEMLSRMPFLIFEKCRPCLLMGRWNGLYLLH